LFSVQKELDEIRAGIFSEDPNLQLRSIVDAERMLNNANPPLIDAFIVAGIVPRLVEFLRKRSLQFLASLVLALFVVKSATDQQTQVVVDAGAVPHLIRLLSSDDSQLHHGSILVLISIVTKKPEFRDFVVECGIVEPLLRLARSDISIDILRLVSVTIMCLVLQQRRTSPIDLIKNMTPTLLEFLQHADDKIVCHACKAVSLAIITTDAVEHAFLIYDFGIVPLLVRLLDHGNVDIVASSLAALTTIACTDDHADAFLEAGALPVIAGLLKHETSEVVYWTIRVISNVFCGRVDQIQKVIDAQILHPLIEVLSTVDLESRKASVRAVRVLSICGTSTQIITLCQHGVLKPMCDLLVSNDVELVDLLLQGIENILAAVKRQGEPDTVAGSIKDCLSVGNLLIHENEEVKKKALKIIKAYFG
jgi:importin subunit alpha-1